MVYEFPVQVNIITFSELQMSLILDVNQKMNTRSVYLGKSKKLKILLCLK